MIYLDNNATTPLDPRALDEMLPFLRDHFGNAASPHAMGCHAATSVESAREEVARLIGADPREIYFTSGATESNNLALLGVAESDYYAPERRHIVSVRTEHAAILDPLRHLASRGFEITLLRVDGEGAIDLDELRAAITDRTRLISVMHANNETGVMHPIEPIGAIAKERGVLFHTDATQTVGKEPFDVASAGADLVSFSAHKFYGPKGVGGLYVRRARPRVRVAPRLLGGGQERGIRSGTANVPGIVGLGKAAQLAREELDADGQRIMPLRDHLEAGLIDLGAIPNGAGVARLAGTTNVSFLGRDARALMRDLPELAISTASACTTAALQPSHVLGAMGFDDARIDGSLRFSLGRFTRASEIEASLDRLRRLLASA